MLKSKKIICFCISDVSACGGTERVCLAIANELFRRGYEIHIISLLTKDKPFFDYEKGIKFHTLLPTIVERKMVHKRWYKIWKLNLVLNRIEADIVIDTTIGDIISSVMSRRKERFMAWIHFSYEFATTYTPHLNSISKIIEKGADMVVLTKKDKQSYIAHGMPVDKVHNICNPLTIEYPQFSYPRSKTVVSAGRFTEIKGFDMLLEAWAVVEQKNKDWSLEIWGDDERYDHNFNELIANLALERASLHSATKEIGMVFQRSSIYVLSSRFESFGLVLLEAGACRLPLVAFDCPNGPGEIIEDGISGILVPKENVEALADAILSLINNDDKRRIMGENAYEMSGRYSVKSIVDQWENLFCSL